MKVAPEPILRAANYTIHWACVFCRNYSLLPGTPLEMINEVMEAIHEVPRTLVDWEGRDLEELRMYFGCFRSSRWPDAPDLVKYFDQRLIEFGYREDKV